MTLAEKFFSSSKSKELIQLLKKEVAAASSQIQGIRPADAEKEQSFKNFLNHVQTIRGRNLFYPYISSGLGNGPYVELMDGSVKIDLINGIGIHLFGHSHEDVIEASLAGALQDVVMQGNLQPNAGYGELLSLLLTQAGKHSRLKRGWIGTCGTIVNENALKIVRQKHSPARKIVAFHDAFAGRSTLMAQITDNPDYRQGLPEYDEVLYLPFYNSKDPQSKQRTLDTLKKYIDENPKNIACFMFEIVQGEGGFNVAPKDFFVPLLELCKKNGIAVWADEVQTFSRTGELFAFEKFGIGDYVDIVTLAKTAQCGAVLYTEEYNPKPGLIAGTYTAASVSIAAGLKILNKLIHEDYLGENGKIQKIHSEFTAMLGRLQSGSCKDHIKDFGGVGLMVAMTPYDGGKEKVAKLLQTLFANGIMAFNCGHGPYKLRFLLPACLEKKHILEIEKVLEKTLIQCAQG